MDDNPQLGATVTPSTDLKRTFRDLRRRNAYSARIGEALEAKRTRRIEQVLTLQRKHRAHRAR